MANYDLGTIGYTVQNTGAPKSIAELKEFARAGLEAHENAKQLSQGDHLSRYFSSIDRQISVVNRNMQNYNRFVSQAGQNSGRFGVVTQQAGYQIGDFLVQVQSGTNWMVAFGQQATQLAGILPLMGAGFMGLSTGALVALSAGLGIAIPLVTAIGAAFMRTGQEAGGSADGVNTFNGALKALNDEIRRGKEDFLKLKFDTESMGIAGASQQIEDLTAKIESLRNLYERLAASSGIVAARSGLMLSEIEDLENQRAVLKDTLSILEEQARVKAYMAAASKRAAQEPSGTYVEEAAAAERVAEARRLEGQYYAQTRMEANQTAGQVALIESGMSQAAVDALRFAGVDLSSGVSSAAKEAATLAANMGISLNAALSLMNMASSMTYGQVGTRGDPRDFIAGGEKSDTKNFRPFSYEPSKNGGGGGGGGGAAQEDALQKLREQIVLENELLGVSEAQKRVIQALGEQRSQYSEAEINAITAEIEAYNQKLEVLKQQEQLAKVMQSSMEDAFMSIIDGTMSAKDAFKKMAYDMIKELYRVLVVQRLVGSFQSGGGGILGAVFKGLGGRESGGSVMAGQPYMVGERGPEIVIPRHSGTVMNANLTRQAASGGGDVIVTNNINVPAGADSASIRAEVSKMIPQITQITKAAVIDAKQRGGQMAAAFR